MQNFFIPLPEPENTRRILAEAGVIVDPLMIDGANGLVFEDSTLPEVLRVLHARAGTKERTSYEGVIKLSLIFNSENHVNAETQHSVKIGRWYSYENINDNAQAIFKGLVKDVLFPTVQKDVIIVLNEEKYLHDPVQDDKFRIFLFSSPSMTHYNHHISALPLTICGINFSKPYNYFEVSGIGTTILDDNGFPIAELIGDNLYILISLHHASFEGSDKIFHYILSEVVSEIIMTSEQKNERDRKIADRRAEFTMKRFVDLCVQQHKKRIEEIASLNAIDEEAIRTAQRTIINNTRVIQARSNELRGLSGDSDQFQKRAQQMYMTALAIPKVVHIEFSSEAIASVETDLLFATDTRTHILHEIGKFRIKFDFNNGTVRWYNLTRQVKGYNDGIFQAPHVFENGEACLGNTEMTFIELMAQRDLPALIMLAILFIESANVKDSAGSYIDKWPEALIQPQTTSQERTV